MTITKFRSRKSTEEQNTSNQLLEPQFLRQSPEPEYINIRDKSYSWLEHAFNNTFMSKDEEADQQENLNSNKPSSSKSSGEKPSSYSYNGSTGQFSNLLPNFNDEFSKLTSIAIDDSDLNQIMNIKDILNVKKERNVLEAKEAEVQEKLKLEQKIKAGAKNILSLSVHNPKQNAMVYAELISTYRREIFLLRQLCSYSLRHVQVLSRNLDHNSAILTRYISTLTENLKDAEQELQEAKIAAQYDYRNNEISRLRYKCTTLSEEIERLKTLKLSDENSVEPKVQDRKDSVSVDNLIKESISLKDQLEETKNSNEKLLKLVKNYELQNENLKNHVKELEEKDEKKREIETSADKLSIFCDKLSAILEDEKAKNPSYLLKEIKKFTKLRKEAVELLEENVKLKNISNDLKEESIESKKAFQMKNYELEECKKELLDVKEEFNKHKNLIAGQLDSLARENTELTSANNQLKQQMNSITVKESDQADDQSSTVRELQDQLSKALQTKDDLEHDCELLVTEMERLTREWTDFDSEKQRLRDELAQSQKQIRNLQSLIVEKQYQLHNRDEYLEETDFFGKMEDLKQEYERQFEEERRARESVEEELSSWKRKAAALMKEKQQV